MSSFFSTVPSETAANNTVSSVTSSSVSALLEAILAEPTAYTHTSQGGGGQDLPAAHHAMSTSFAATTAAASAEATRMRQAFMGNLAPVVLDCRHCTYSAQALHVIQHTITHNAGSFVGKPVQVLAGDLILSEAWFADVAQQCLNVGAYLDTIVSGMPQTQKIALQQGFTVHDSEQQRLAPAAPSAAVVTPQQVQYQGDVAPVQPQFLPQEFPQPTSQPVSQDPLPTWVAQSLSGIVLNRSGIPVQPALDSLTVGLPPEGPVEAAIESAPQPSVQPLVQPLAPSQSVVVPSERLVTQPLPETVRPLPVTPAPGASAQVHATVPLGLAQYSLTQTQPTIATLLYPHTLRSGQTIVFDGNVVVLGDVHNGSEITASGDVVIWGYLRGIAHAGAPTATDPEGSREATIRALAVEAVQLRIANCMARRPDRLFNHKPMPHGMVSPEVVKIVGQEIQIIPESLL